MSVGKTILSYCIWPFKEAIKSTFGTIFCIIVFLAYVGGPEIKNPVVGTVVVILLSLTIVVPLVIVNYVVWKNSIKKNEPNILKFLCSYSLSLFVSIFTFYIMFSVIALSYQNVTSRF